MAWVLMGFMIYRKRRWFMGVRRLILLWLRFWQKRAHILYEGQRS